MQEMEGGGDLPGILIFALDYMASANKARNQYTHLGKYHAKTWLGVLLQDVYQVDPDSIL